MEKRYNGTMLDCINDSPKACERIISNRKENFKGFFEYLNERVFELEEIVFVGSGTSNTSAITSRIFVEKVTQIKTSVITANDFIYNTFVYNPKALYVFTSQTGTSIVAREAVNMIKEKGYLNVALSEEATTPIAKEASSFISMDCGKEEYPMRTTGYFASVLVHMLLALEIALVRKTISLERYNEYIEEAEKISASHKEIVEKTLKWLEFNKFKMLRSDLIVFTGADALYGVSLEGAMKVWETLQVASVGYEIEEGLHGPNYGYDHKHCVIVLNEGGRENNKNLALARYMKEVWQNGFVVGKNIVDDDDLKLDLQTKDFVALEFAPVVQVIAYELAKAQGRDLCAKHDNSKMESYFKTHA